MALQAAELCVSASQRAGKRGELLKVRWRAAGDWSAGGSFGLLMEARGTTYCEPYLPAQSQPKKLRSSNFLRARVAVPRRPLVAPSLDTMMLFALSQLSAPPPRACSCASLSDDGRGTRETGIRARWGIVGRNMLDLAVTNREGSRSNWKMILSHPWIQGVWTGRGTRTKVWRTICSAENSIQTIRLDGGPLK
jgi:hypothetical protein